MDIRNLTLLGMLVPLVACGGGGGGGGDDDSNAGNTPPPPLPLASGSMDTTFGTDGVMVIDLGGERDTPLALEIQSDGKLVIAGGDPSVSVDEDAVLARFDGADGSPDADFGSGGIVTTDLGGADVAFGLAIQPDGQIIAAGASFEAVAGNEFDIALARFNAADGSLDATFGANGKRRTNLNGRDRASAVAVQSSGRIVIAGTTDTSNATENFVLVGYDTGGTRDLTFSPTDGVERTDFNNREDFGQAIALDADERIVTAGWSGAHMALTRHDADGNPDPTFGPNFDGRVITTEGLRSRTFAVAVQPDGKIVTAGNATYASGDAILVTRYLDNGSLDTTGFGVLGVAVHDLGSSGEEAVAGIAIQTDGKIVLTGGVEDNGEPVLVVLRLNPDGSLDTGFGNNGVVMPAIPGANRSWGMAVKIQTDGKLVAAGVRVDSNGVQDAVLVRVNP